MELLAPSTTRFHIHQHRIWDLSTRSVTQTEGETTYRTLRSVERELLMPEVFKERGVYQGLPFPTQALSSTQS